MIKEVDEILAELDEQIKKKKLAKKTTRIVMKNVRKTRNKRKTD
jgi:hypothetical protein